MEKAVLAAANNDDLQVQKMKEVLTDPQDEGIVQLLIYLLLCKTRWLAVALGMHCSIDSKSNDALECGLMPNVIATLPNIGGALCESSVIPFLVPRCKVW